MSTGAAAPKETLPLTPDQKQTVAKVASTAWLVAVLLLLLGLILIVAGPVATLWYGAGVWSALLSVIQGALTAFLGLVMLATASDFRYLGEYPKFGGNHLRNAVNNLKVFYQVQLALALLLALVMVIRLAV
jgi:hypothetical protein